MSSVRSALDELFGVDDEQLSVEGLATDVSELVHVGQMVEVLIARKVEAIGSRDGFDGLGYSSATAFLCDVGRMTPWTARRVVSRSRMREVAPHTHAAWSDGRLTTGQARCLLRLSEQVPDVFQDAERRLVEIVEGLDAVDTRRALEYWRQSIDGPGDLDPADQDARRGLSLSRSYGGMRRVDGWLTILAGEALEAALDANMPPPGDGDARTLRQRRHDGLENLVRDWLDNGTTPTVGGEKPHIVVHTDFHALRGDSGGLHETQDGDIIDVDTLRMVACDCSITRVVFDSASEILDLGRKTRVWSAAQRRAVIARDRHCQGPGCRARARHCDIHHLEHWADGGPTNLDNGLLLCRSCHTNRHRNGRYHRRRART